LFKEKTNQQLKLLNLFMSYGGINSKNWLYLSVKETALFYLK
jgi:hypothetical protein